LLWHRRHIENPVSLHLIQDELSWLRYNASMSTQVANKTCFNLKTIWNEVKASILLACRCNAGVTFRKLVGMPLSARSSSNFHNEIGSLQLSSYHSHFFVSALCLTFCIWLWVREVIYGFAFWHWTPTPNTDWIDESSWLWLSVDVMFVMRIKTVFN